MEPDVDVSSSSSSCLQLWQSFSRRVCQLCVLQGMCVPIIQLMELFRKDQEKLFLEVLKSSEQQPGEDNCW